MSSRAASARGATRCAIYWANSANQSGASARSHFGGKFPHGFLRDDAAFAAGKSSAGIIEGRQKRHAAAFAVFPQRKCFLYGFFLAVEPPAVNGAAGECFLIGRKLHFHRVLLLLCRIPCYSTATPPNDPQRAASVAQ